MEDLIAAHKKEQRDMQARITQKKKSATKKTRKGVNAECDELERQLKEKQDREVAELNGISTTTDKIEDPIEDDPEIPDELKEHKAVLNQLENLELTTQSPNQPEQPRKQNRQKARLARRAADQEAAATAAAREAADQPNLRERERITMLKAMNTLGLRETPIRPDGHCLYSSVADQLGGIGLGLEPKLGLATITNGIEPNGDDREGYKRVRQAAADYISSHPEDFEPFLEEPLTDYVHKVRDTAEWGGQLELLALARTYGVKINVLQGDGRIEKVGSGEDKEEGKELWLAYYRHTFGLGEHYNSLRKRGP